jgi:hypothetical protein
MKRYFPAVMVFMLIFCANARSMQQQVMDKYFPECNNQQIGATQGADCRYDEKSKEWRIQYWGEGFGDCPAGCIHKTYYGAYLVDEKGDIYESSRDFTVREKIKPEQISRSGSSNRVMAAAPDVNPDNKLGCLKKSDCFWYQCCHTEPMSKVYRQKHWKDENLLNAESDHCVMECEHAPVPKDQKLACVAFQCRAVAKDFPEVNPSRPVVWVGRVVALPQCIEKEASANLFTTAPVIKRSNSPEIALGEKFSAWAAQQEKGLTAGKENKFTCKACDICYHLNRDYLLVFADDLAQFNKLGWREVAP